MVIFPLGPIQIPIGTTGEEAACGTFYAVVRQQIIRTVMVVTLIAT
jgi:hypothetical protein|tara:strand:- start:413 stop:550 length:138 start_codon:yes stop_codon:yes gene_type:complete